jgi:hypothetical protein
MERLHKLLAILHKRPADTPGLADRIARVEADIAAIGGASPEKKKKKVVLQEVEVDD